jgi:8-amino-3,8-dideoxy-alpha-D-manno-octulosonate transaminase
VQRIAPSLFLGGVAMRLPYILHPFYRLMRDVVPEPIKPTTRGLYNMANKFVTYGRTDIFTALDMEINSDCNMRCSYCPISIESRGATLMPEALFLKVLRDLSEFPYTGRISPHFYGEPTLDRRLVRLMAQAREIVPGAALIIHTNGTKLTRKLYRDLIKVGVDGFLITRHAPKWPTNVLDIVDNEPDAESYIRMHNFDRTALYNRGGTVKPRLEKKLRRCFLLSDEIAITHDGEVVCTNDFHITESFGNVNSQHLLREIWWGASFTNVRKRLQSGHFDFEVCQKCSGSKAPEHASEEKAIDVSVESLSKGDPRLVA